MSHSHTPVWGVLPLLLLAYVSGACGGDGSTHPTHPGVPPPPHPANEVPSLNSASALQAYTGIPYGVSDLWKNGTVVWGPVPFTASNNYTDPATLVAQLNAARAMGQKLVLNMTGGGKTRYKTDGKFDLAKWKAVMNTYDRADIKAAVRDAVADGTVIVNSVMDEPSVVGWGGVMTKPLLDEMAQYVKNMFPTLPVGVVNRYDWRLHEQYEIMDAILAQYQWNKGSVTVYRDNVLAQAKREGLSVVFSINVLDGGIINWTTRDCPIPLTGGFGTYSPTCRMTAQQVREWGRLLGVAGCAMNMWRYDQEFMAKPENEQAFRDVAATLATVPGKPCVRTTTSAPPPANTPPVAAFASPTCTAGSACEFSDASTDADGIISTRAWEFGDGASSTAANPSHTYAVAGTYSVTLTVSDDDGERDADTTDVTVLPAANLRPSADFFARRCTAGVACQFSDNSTDPDGSIALWSWDFGNGETSSAADPSTTYLEEGTYDVTLTVTDNAGNTDASTKAVTVTLTPNIQPTAAFSAPDCTEGQDCQFEDASNDPDGSISSWKWDFGGGMRSTAANPSVTFAAAGSETVTLTVTDDAGDTATATEVVTISPAPNVLPIAAFTTPSCAAGVPCQFTDASSDPDGSIATRSWDFGDGATSTETNPSTTYSTAGSYEVTLTVTDDAGDTDAIARTVTVSPANLPPSADFTPPSCTAGAACQFNDASADPDGSIVSRSWLFGNGTASTAMNPSVTYSVQGSYQVTLTVTDDAGGSDTRTQSVTVTPAPNIPPTAAFTPPLSTPGAACQFKDTSSDPDGTISALTWQFGNGATATGAAPAVTYAAAGSYSVTLTVTDNAGSTSSISKTVTVGPAPTTTPITLSLAGSIKDSRQYVMVTWSGLGGQSVDIYRDGVLLLTTVNDGRQNTIIPLQGKASYIYKVCEMGKTRCSASVTFKLPSILLNVTAWMKEPDLQAMTLLWAGATGTTMDVYRNGVRITSTANTGRYTITRRSTAAITYTFKVCVTATTKCSNTDTGTFP